MALKALDGGMGAGAAPTLNNFSVLPNNTPSVRFGTNVNFQEDPFKKQVGDLVKTGFAIKNQLDDDDADDKAEKWMAYNSSRLQQYQQLAGNNALKDAENNDVFNNYYTDRVEYLSELTEGMNARQRDRFNKRVADSDRAFDRGMESHRFESYKDVSSMRFNTNQTENAKLFYSAGQSNDWEGADKIYKNLKSDTEEYLRKWTGAPEDIIKKLSGLNNSKMLGTMIDNAFNEGNSELGTKFLQLYGGDLNAEDWSRLIGRAKEGAYASVGRSIFEAIQRGEKTFTFQVPDFEGKTTFSSKIPPHMKNIVSLVQKELPNFNPEFMLTHFNFEGGDFNRKWAVDNHNYAGIKFRKWMEKYGVKANVSGTKEDYGKGLVNTKDAFAQFPSDEAFAQVYARIMGTTHKAALNAKTIGEFGRSLMGSKYATDKTYDKKLEARYNSVIKGAVTGTGSPKMEVIDLSQFKGFNTKTALPEDFRLIAETVPFFKQHPEAKKSFLSYGDVIGAVHAKQQQAQRDAEDRKYKQAMLANDTQRLALSKEEWIARQQSKDYMPSETDMNEFHTMAGMNDANQWHRAAWLFTNDFGSFSEGFINMRTGGDNLLNKVMKNEYWRNHPTKGKFTNTIPPMNVAVRRAIFQRLGLPYGKELSEYGKTRFGDIAYAAIQYVMDNKEGKTYTTQDMVNAVYQADVD